MSMARLSLDPSVPYAELRDPPLDERLRTLLLRCFELQRRAASEAGMGPAGEAQAFVRAERAASPETLAALLAKGRPVAGILSERDIATAIPFNVRNVSDTVRSRSVAAARRRLDRELARWLETLFAPEDRPVFFPAGHWWYPPGSHLGWHTNERYPGWRLYLSHAEEPGASYFRYRDPRSGAVVTSPDGWFDLRLFEVSTERRLWHAVASATHRFSIGWILKPRTLRNTAAHAVKRMLEALPV